MTKNEFGLVVRRVLEDYDIDDRNLAVEDFLEDLGTTLEYETDLVFDEPEELEDEDEVEED